MPRLIKKESRAWLALAEAHALGNLEGLCETINAGVVCLPESLKDRMKDQLRDQVYARFRSEVDASWSYAFAHYRSADSAMTGKERRDARVLACLVFAEQAKAEGR